MLLDTEKQFKCGSLNKQDYISAMYGHHAMLFEYPHLLKHSDIASLEITEHGVIARSRQNGIKIAWGKLDQRAAPLESLNFGGYEKTLLAMMYKLIHDGDTLLDIGAHIGWHAIHFAKQFPRSRIFAFEPIPENFLLLQQNISINGADNIAAFPIGLFSEKSQKDFYYYPDVSASASLADLNTGKSLKRITCELKTLDALVTENQIAVNFIKCDVEGSELFVFQGALNSLTKYQPVIFVEMLRKWTGKFNYHPNDTIELLGSIGYRCFSLGDNVLKAVPSVNESTIPNNFFFLHTYKHKGLIENLSQE